MRYDYERLSDLSAGGNRYLRIRFQRSRSVSISLRCFYWGSNSYSVQSDKWSIKGVSSMRNSIINDDCLAAGLSWQVLSSLIVHPLGLSEEVLWFWPVVHLKPNSLDRSSQSLTAHGQSPIGWQEQVGWAQRILWVTANNLTSDCNEPIGEHQSSKVRFRDIVKTSTNQ
jgi:hypothetical protein